MCPSSQVTTASFGCLSLFLFFSLIRTRDGTQQPEIQKYGITEQEHDPLNLISLQCEQRQGHAGGTEHVSFITSK